MTTDKSQFANAPIIQGQMIAQPMAQPILVPGQQMHAADGATRSEVSDQLRFFALIINLLEVPRTEIEVSP